MKEYLIIYSILTTLTPTIQVLSSFPCISIIIIWIVWWWQGEGNLSSLSLRPLATVTELPMRNNTIYSV